MAFPLAIVPHVTGVPIAHVGGPQVPVAFVVNSIQKHINRTVTNPVEALWAAAWVAGSGLAPWSKRDFHIRDTPCVVSHQVTAEAGAGSESFAAAILRRKVPSTLF